MRHCPRHWLRLISLTLLLALLAACGGSDAAPQPDSATERLRLFQNEIEALRVQYNIPGISVAVVQDSELILARGFGYANLAERVPATAQTTYHIASITKPIVATMLMQLVEAGQLDLDAAFATYDPDYAALCAELQQPNAYAISNYNCATRQITIRNHLAHTALGEPGERYLYHSGVYGLLDRVVEQTTGQPFDAALTERIIAPVQMTMTAPGQANAAPEILAALAQPYASNLLGRSVPASYPTPVLDAAAGMISNVEDLARFNVALDQNQLVSAETKAAMWTPTMSTSGQALPYGLGWFVQDIAGTQVVWHYGWWPEAFAALLVKVPEQDITMVLLANSDGGSTLFNLGAGNLLRSPFVVPFFDRLTSLDVAYE